MSKESDRRQFLKFLAASPLMAMGGGSLMTGSGGLFDSGDPIGTWFQGQQGATIKSPNEAINVWDFEAKAREVQPPQHFAYMDTGSDGNETKRANEEGFAKYVWHPHRLRNVSTVDPSVQLWGKKYETPIFTAPTSSQKTWHPDGELAVARGSKVHKNTQVLSTSSGTPIEEVVAVGSSPVWFQLYPNGSFPISKKLVTRAEAAGAPAICMTVDQLPGRNTEADRRAYWAIPGFNGSREKSTSCSGCHGPDRNVNREMSRTAFAGEKRGDDAALTWDFVKQLRDVVKGKFMLKGVMTPEDAELSLKYGLDAIYVSNHGGRSAATGYGTIDALPSIVSAVNGKVPIIIDGGIRRGTSVFKALALGASAVVVGRPTVWGLGSFGEPGVAKVLDILQREFELVMAQAGVTNVPAIRAGRYVTKKA